MPPKPAGETEVRRRRFDLPVDQREVARTWLERGFSCQGFVDPPGREWNDFVHATRELVTVQEGRLRMTLDGQTLELEPGDELLIPGSMRHSVKNVHRGTTRWLFGYD